MPEISRFFGIVIKMYYNDHAPPHFHAEYGSHEVIVRIDPISVMRGFMPPRALAMVLEWALIHRAELLSDWDRARQKQQLNRIEGLS